MKLSENAKLLLKKRYLMPGESFEGLFRRVAKSASRNDKELEKEFYKIMTNLEFLPNSPCLMNAGTKIGQLLACFVLPIEDSLVSIYDTLKNAAIIYQSGGGVGFDFSKIRPRGDLVKTTNGVASGPVSFIKLYNESTEVVKQGGRRRGANMAVLRVDHPDIMEFINSKKEEGRLPHFNISVGITSKFMDALKKDSKYDLINPRTRRVVKKVQAEKVFDNIIENMHSNGEPGIIFLDRLGKGIAATNPCGEVPLEPYEACVLGSINLSKVIVGEKINYEKLGELVRLGVKFLNNILDINKYPLPKIRKKCLKNRKVGLGVMGFADMLIKIKVRYDSASALRIADEVMGFIKSTAKKYSENNKTLLSIAPTGSISIIADCSSSIDPVFSESFNRSINEGDVLSKKYENSDYLVTLKDVKSEQQVKMQAVFQKHVDNAVSKTISFNNDASKSDVKKVVLLGYELGIKGLTVYRDKSREKQVICEVCKNG
ncbi:Vitamin B12-dependent ribonucleoside-diphosphate reductase [Candidatus Tiddalikarchaeum anstoanum]|nr:Vitamin B12-dependent ribonucleoside-diphosphate reductase [Candidatus Tiddalikarchaeum anstoanum]